MPSSVQSDLLRPQAMPTPSSESEIEVTSEMIEAGEVAIWERLGGYDLGGRFSARQLAEEVYRAMASRRRLVSDAPLVQV